MQHTRQQRRSTQRMAWLWLVAALGLSGGLSPLQASSFDVFCTDNGDGTQSCQGWQGGEALTCTRSSGSTTSCSTPSGRSFTCTRNPGGVISCGSLRNQRERGRGPNCVLAGDGNLVCNQEEQPTPPLIPSPALPRPVDPLEAPALTPSLPGGFSLPSLFD